MCVNAHKRNLEVDKRNFELDKRNFRNLEVDKRNFRNLEVDKRYFREVLKRRLRAFTPHYIPAFIYIYGSPHIKH